MKNSVVNGNCLEIMRSIPDKSIDLILTDPPYNAKNIGPNEKVYSLGTMQLPIEEYKDFCSKWIIQALRIAHRVVFTPGIANMCYYPQPNWAICWHKPQAVSFNRMGGFNVWEPIFVYGGTAKGKRLPHDHILQNIFNLSKGPEKDHPCPKPLPLIKKLLDIFSNEGDMVLDPFLGSGTTAVAAKFMNRNYIGIEINPEYCKIAQERLSQENIFNYV